MPFSIPPLPGESGTAREVRALGDAMAARGLSLNEHQFTAFPLSDYREENESDVALCERVTTTGQAPWVYYHNPNVGELERLYSGPRYGAPGVAYSYDYINSYTVMTYLGGPYRPNLDDAVPGQFISPTKVFWMYERADGLRVRHSNGGLYTVRWQGTVPRPPSEWGANTFLEAVHRGRYDSRALQDGASIRFAGWEPAPRLPDDYGTTDWRQRRDTLVAIGERHCPLCLRSESSTPGLFDMVPHPDPTLRRQGLYLTKLAPHLVSSDDEASSCLGHKLAGAFSWVTKCKGCGQTSWRSENSSLCLSCVTTQQRIQLHGAQPSDLLFGVEIETEGIACNLQGGKVATEDLKGRWVAKYDGSLRGASTEFTTPPLPFNSEGIEELRQGAREVRNAGARASERCGVHIHVDCNKLSVPQLQRLMRGWVGMQPAVLSALPVLYHRQTYCKSLNMETVRDAECRADKAGLSQVTAKYSTLNFRHLNGGYGTVEFRLFNGTVHRGKLVAYVRLCTHIVAKCSQPGFELKLYTPNRAGMTQLLDDLDITCPSARYHLLGVHATDADIPVSNKKKRLRSPIMARRKRVFLGAHVVIMSGKEYTRLGLTASVRNLATTDWRRMRRDVRALLTSCDSPTSTWLQEREWIRRDLSPNQPYRISADVSNHDYKLVIIRRQEWDAEIASGRITFPPPRVPPAKEVAA